MILQHKIYSAIDASLCSGASDEELSEKARTINDSLIQSTCTCTAYLSLDPLAMA